MQFTRLIAIRHGETAWNKDTRLQGKLDIPLNATGQWQAERAAQALRDEPLTAVYGSDLSRAWHTAQAIAAPHGLVVQPELALRERGFGKFEGRTFAEIEALWPDEALRWRKRDIDYVAGETGESLMGFRARVTEVVDQLAARHAGELIALVAHGGVMDVLYRAATRQTLQAPRTWQLGNAAINRLMWTPDGLTLVGWADEGHLSQGPLDEASC